MKIFAGEPHSLAKKIGFCGGICAVILSLTHLPAHYRVALRQTIPVKMSLAEAEASYEDLADEAKKRVEEIKDQSANLTSAESGNQLVTLLRGHSEELKSLGTQLDVMTKQAAIYESALESELSNWSDAASEIEDSSARIREQQKIVASQIAFEQKLAIAKSDADFVARVLNEGKDIDRLLACVSHESAVAKSLDGLGGLTGEIRAFANRMQSTTSSVLLAWK